MAGTPTEATDEGPEPVAELAEHLADVGAADSEELRVALHSRTGQLLRADVFERTVLTDLAARADVAVDGWSVSGEAALGDDALAVAIEAAEVPDHALPVATSGGPTHARLAAEHAYRELRDADHALPAGVLRDRVTVTVADPAWDAALATLADLPAVGAPGDGPVLRYVDA